MLRQRRSDTCRSICCLTHLHCLIVELQIVPDEFGIRYGHGFGQPNLYDLVAFHHMASCDEDTVADVEC